jgi:hypothetical protein
MVCFSTAGLAPAIPIMESQQRAPARNARKYMLSHKKGNRLNHLKRKRSFWNFFCLFCSEESDHSLYQTDKKNGTFLYGKPNFPEAEAFSMYLRVKLDSVG